MNKYPIVKSLLLILVEAAVLAALTWFVHREVGSPFNPKLETDGGLGPHLLLTAWWIACGRLAVHIGRLLLGGKSHGYEVQIVSDLLAAVIYLTTIFAVIRFAFGLPIGGLLATSGVIAIVLGLALQSTLGDVFSGIAVGLERPYKPGDIVSIEGVDGTVVQVTWRSTQIATGYNNIVIIPNSIIAKARLENRSAPTTMRGDNVVLSLDPHVDPRRCIAALSAAVRACTVPLSAPAPKVLCNGLQGDGAKYEIWYSVGSSKDIGAARTEIFTQVHRYLRHSGIALAVAGQSQVQPVKVPMIRDLLDQSEIFGVLAPEEREALAKQFAKVSFDSGQVLVKEGSPPSHLYMLASGTTEIDHQGRALSIRRLGPGEAFGLIALILDEPYAVSVKALTPLSAYCLTKEGIAAAIKEHPEMLTGLEALARRGQEILERELAPHEETPLKTPEMFLSRLRQFLSRVGS